MGGNHVCLFQVWPQHAFMVLHEIVLLPLTWMELIPRASLGCSVEEGWVHKKNDSDSLKRSTKMGTLQPQQHAIDFNISIFVTTPETNLSVLNYWDFGFNLWQQQLEFPKFEHETFMFTVKEGLTFKRRNITIDCDFVAETVSVPLIIVQCVNLRKKSNFKIQREGVFLLLFQIS